MDQRDYECQLPNPCLEAIMGPPDPSILASWFRDRDPCICEPPRCGVRARRSALLSGHRDASGDARQASGTQDRATELKWWELKKRSLAGAQWPTCPALGSVHLGLGTRSRLDPRTARLQA
jgi:hypothetical protein